MEKKFIRVEEVARELDVSVPYAYKIIRKLNDELKAKGYDENRRKAASELAKKNTERLRRQEQ